ncbi:MAG TPA: LamB/YcsF family protein [Candidatus Dormibacteraeota bacterium]|nr:LamB/YcsF family protein [Candidatus Dormibacteraeota bacterium]
MNVNADIGEGADEDEAILASVDSANVACAVHAGSASITIATAWRCRKLGIEVGGHPGYDDRAGFGRVDRSIGPDEIEALIAFQIAGLAAVVPIAYVKPHGALYHRCQRDPGAADALARVASAHGVGVVGQPGFEIEAAAGRAGIPAYREGFADRLMLPDGSLAPRGQAGAILTAPVAAEQAVALARSGRYDTICVHGDTKGAGQLAAAVRAALRDAGIETAPLVR